MVSIIIIIIIIIILIVIINAFLTIHEEYLCLTGNNDFFFKLIIVMDSSLPTSLKHIISNVEYYGPVLFMAGMMLFCLLRSKLVNCTLFHCQG